VEAWSTGNVSFSGDSSVRGAQGVEEVSVSTVGPGPVSVESVTGTVTVDGATTEFSDARSFSVKDFRGSVDLSVENSTVQLNGTATRVEAGSLVYR